jgi:hypothetical protein
MKHIINPETHEKDSGYKFLNGNRKLAKKFGEEIITYFLLTTFWVFDATRTA